MRRGAVMLALGLALAPACGSEEAEDAPAPVAPPSRHAALRDALVVDAKAFAFSDGDWEEDLGDAPFFGLGWLTHRKPLEGDELARRDQAVSRARAVLAGPLLEGDLQDKVMAALGLIDHVAMGDRSVIGAVDEFVDSLDSLTKTLGDYLEAGADRSWAIRTYGPTAVTALVALLEAQYALYVGGERANERLERAKAIDAKIAERAFGDLGTVRGYAVAPGRADLEIYPNVSMMMLKTRLFRITKDEAYRLEARALYAAIQPLKLSDAPARYASPYASTLVGAKTNDVSTLSSQNYLALALMLLFEITGDQRFVDEADRVLDSIETMRGNYCIGDATQRCASGLLHHFVDGRLAEPGDGTLFCSGCNLQTLYVLGYRRGLANEPW
jgi:hypothetical protein